MGDGLLRPVETSTTTHSSSLDFVPIFWRILFLLILLSSEPLFWHWKRQKRTIEHKERQKWCKNYWSTFECIQLHIYFHGKIYPLILTLHLISDLTHCSLSLYKGILVLWVKFLQLPQIETQVHPCESHFSRPFRNLCPRCLLSLWNRIFFSLHLTSDLVVSHLQYGDETIILEDASLDNLWAIKNILCGFKLALGLLANISKSSLIGVNYSPAFLDIYFKFLHYTKKYFPFKYLRMSVEANPRLESM